MLQVIEDLLNPDAAPESESVKICKRQGDCHLCDLDQALYLVHSCCWQMAQTHSMQFSVDTLKRLALQTRPMTAWGAPFYEKIHLAPSLEAIRGILESKTSRNNPGLMALLRAMAARLPTEMQVEIMSYLEGSMVSALLLTMKTASLLHLIKPSGPSEIPKLKELSGFFSKANILCAETSRIFGRTYLRQVELLEMGQASAKVSTNSVTVRLDDFRGLKYILGTHGVHALSILYQDGSSSPWLGTPANGWISKTYSRYLGNVCVEQDVRLTIPLN